MSTIKMSHHRINNIQSNNNIIKVLSLSLYHYKHKLTLYYDNIFINYLSYYYNYILNKNLVIEVIITDINLFNVHFLFRNMLF